MCRAQETACRVETDDRARNEPVSCKPGFQDVGMDGFAFCDGRDEGAGFHGGDEGGLSGETSLGYCSKVIKKAIK